MILDLCNGTVLPRLLYLHFGFGVKSCIALPALQTVWLLCSKGRNTNMLYQEGVRNDTCFLLLNLCNSLLYSCQVFFTCTNTCITPCCLLKQLKKCGLDISGNSDHLLRFKYNEIKSPVISPATLIKKKLIRSGVTFLFSFPVLSSFPYHQNKACILPILSADLWFLDPIHLSASLFLHLLQWAQIGVCFIFIFRLHMYFHCHCLHGSCPIKKSDSLLKCHHKCSSKYLVKLWQMLLSPPLHLDIFVWYLRVLRGLMVVHWMIRSN